MFARSSDGEHSLIPDILSGVTGTREALIVAAFAALLVLPSLGQHLIAYSAKRGWLSSPAT